MRRISTSTRVIDKFGAGKDGFTNGDAVSGLPSTDLEDVWFDHVQEEIANVIEASGASLNPAVRTQLRDAIKTLYGPGRLIRTTVYRNNAGTLQASVNGGAFATASSTFSAQTLTTLVGVEVLGAGAGGGGAPACAGGQVSGGAGGGGGGYARGQYASGFNGVTVAAGLGGAGGSGGANGTGGGSSSFGALISATGGGGGSFSAAATPTNIPGGVGVAGSGSNGQINSSGGAGKYFFAYSNPISGEGGASSFGGGATYANTGAGAAAVTPGAGGAGAAASSNGPFAGGSGATGLVIVREYA
jgi:hypothetical protein